MASVSTDTLQCVCANPKWPKTSCKKPFSQRFAATKNLVDVHPLVQFQVTPSVTGSFGWMWYWKESGQDRVYAFGNGILIAPAQKAQSDYLGTKGDLEIRWAPAPHFIVAVNLMGFRPGRSLVDQINARGPIGANTGITYRF